MKTLYFLAGLPLSFWLSACAVVNTAGDIAQGRQAMLEGNYQLALDYFWAGDQIDPHYMYGRVERFGLALKAISISSGKIDWSQLIAGGESLGIGIEQEEDDFRVQVLRS